MPGNTVPPSAGRQRRRTRRAHGTRAAYVLDGCRCPECREANRCSGQARTRALAVGRWSPFVDAARARAHVEQLRASGVGVNQIVALSGVGSGTLRGLMYGDRRTGRPLRRIRPATEARILGVDPTQRAGGSLVAAIGTVRRLQSLVAAGWSVPRMAHELGRSPASLHRVLGRARVTTRTAMAVHGLYARLEAVPAPQRTLAEQREAAAAREYAARRGWRAPLAWDDVDTDPTPAQPTQGPSNAIDEVAVERALDGELVALTAREQTEVIRRLHARGVSDRQISALLSTSSRTVARRRQPTVA
jgi:hypothetical protein